MDIIPSEKVKCSLSVRSGLVVFFLSAVLVGVMPEIVPSHLWMPCASSAFCTCRAWFLEGNEIGSIFCHASKISLKSALWLRLFKFGSKELTESELHLFVLVQNTRFLIFQQRMCFQVWFC